MFEFFQNTTDQMFNSCMKRQSFDNDEDLLAEQFISHQNNCMMEVGIVGFTICASLILCSLLIATKLNHVCKEKNENRNPTISS